MPCRTPPTGPDLAVLIGGWGFGLAQWKTVLPGYAAMMPDAALAIVLAGSVVRTRSSNL